LLQAKTLRRNAELALTDRSDSLDIAALYSQTAYPRSWSLLQAKGLPTIVELATGKGPPHDRGACYSQKTYARSWRVLQAKRLPTIVELATSTESTHDRGPCYRQRGYPQPWNFLRPILPTPLMVGHATIGQPTMIGQLTTRKEATHDRGTCFDRSFRLP
jgi:hypothetical protein